MRVALVFSPASRVTVEEAVDLPDGSTVANALTISGWRDRFSLDAGIDISFGIWNHPATLKTVLRPDDRLEVYRPLGVDPKFARRERFNRQGTKATGLFATRRPGAKPGY